MKKRCYYLILLAAFFWSVSAQQSELQSFTIRGEIEGLVPGDSLFFERIVLPGWKLKPAFDMAVTEPGRFSYTGTQSHIENFLMTYKPLSGIPLRVDRRGVKLLMREGSTVTLTGTVDKIYYCRQEGGVYDDPLLQELLALEDSIGMERGQLFGLRAEAEAAGDSARMKEYTQQINDFKTRNADAYKRAQELESAFFEKEPSSEYYLLHCVERVESSSFTDSKAAFERMEPEAQQSYYGKILKAELDKMEVFQPGNPAPDFHLVTLDGKEIERADFAGSHLLFYHWGLCPGSIMLDKRVLALYEKYKEQGFQVIGVTPGVDMIRAYEAQTAPNIDLMGVLMKPVLQGMLVHPWLDVEEKDGNEKIVESYLMPGFPYFILVSPDGKFVRRGYFEALDEIETVLAEQYPDANAESAE